jgi:DNA-binding response OmpR family regulator
VLLDVVLPDIDGFEVLAKMRQHDLVKNVPVIMATAKATREAVLTGLQRGADGYVTKPYDMDVLLKTIKTVLGIGK